jgi:hypothetical protein
LADEAEMAQVWKEWSASPIDEAAFQKTRSEAIRYAYCGSGGASWVIHGLSRSPEDAVDRLRFVGTQAPELLDAVLKEKDCPISEQDKAPLKMLRELFSRTPSGQSNP